MKAEPSYDEEGLSNQRPSLGLPHQRPPLSLSRPSLGLPHQRPPLSLSRPTLGLPHQQPPLSLSQPSLGLPHQQPPLGLPHQQPPLSLSKHKSRVQEGRPTLRRQMRVKDSILSEVKQSLVFEEIRKSMWKNSSPHLELSLEDTILETMTNNESRTGAGEQRPQEQASEKEATTEPSLETLIRRLIRIKISFALIFGFINGVTFRLSSRYATMMTGNALTLALELLQLKGSGDLSSALFTLSLIVSYEIGAIMFYFAWYEYDTLRQRFLSDKAESDGPKQTSTTHKKSKVVSWFVVVVSIVMGALADVLRLKWGCLPREATQLDIHRSNTASVPGEQCTANGFYYLCPVAVVTGMLAGGYLTIHPTGVTTNMITGHLGKLPQLGMKIVSRSQVSSKDDMYEFRLSFGIVVLFFGGALAGYMLPSLPWNPSHFRPTFIIFSVWVSVLITAFEKAYDQLCNKLAESKEDD